MESSILLCDIPSNEERNETVDTKLKIYAFNNERCGTVLSASTTSDWLHIQNNRTVMKGGSVQLGVDLRIALYSIIFLLSVIGNSLVILTLVQNRRMRTVTNVFLLNLAVSDMLLAVFCMPFTLIPTLLQNFIFGQFMCIMIRYLQGVSVAVSVFTLVSISLERYFAICQPLKSRAWQTLSHAYKMIAAVWTISFIIMIPIAVFQKLMRIGENSFKCLEEWNSPTWEMAYTLFLDALLLIGPLALMLLAYTKISWTLWNGIKVEIRNSHGHQQMNNVSRENKAKEIDKRYEQNNLTNSNFKLNTKCHEQDDSSSSNSKLIKPKENSNMQCNINKNNNRLNTTQKYELRHKLRQSNTGRGLAAKKRVIRMLFVLVLEFFVCWTPMYVLQTWFIFDHKSATQSISPMTMNFIHLLSYVSSCCNPITYCFMNEKFRQGFLAVFRCCRRESRTLGRGASRNTFCSQRTGINVHQMNVHKHGERKKLLSLFRSNVPTYHVCDVNNCNNGLCYKDESLV